VIDDVITQDAIISCKA